MPSSSFPKKKVLRSLAGILSNQMPPSSILGSSGFLSAITNRLHPLRSVDIGAAPLPSAIRRRGITSACSSLSGGVNRWVREFHSSCSVPYSAGPARDVSLDGASQEEEEEELENTGSSSDQKLPGDRTLKLLSGSCYLPHPDKEETGGEDAHFICIDGQAVGVADGVGGWADLGIDAGQYARELMSHSVNAIQEEPKGSIDPARVLERAYSSTKARGSSTACIIALTDQGVHAVNLGDSGFIVVRDGCTISRSPVQQHHFNFTYQLESGNGSDLPSAAQTLTKAKSMPTRQLPLSLEGLRRRLLLSRGLLSDMIFRFSCKVNTQNMTILSTWKETIYFLLDYALRLMMRGSGSLGIRQGASFLVNFCQMSSSMMSLRAVMHSLAGPGNLLRRHEDKDDCSDKCSICLEEFEGGNELTCLPLLGRCTCPLRRYNMYWRGYG